MYVAVVLLIVWLVAVPAADSFKHDRRSYFARSPFTTSSDLQWGAACDQDNDTGTANTGCPVAGSRCGYTSAADGADTQCCTASPNNYDGFNYCTRVPRAPRAGRTRCASRIAAKGLLCSRLWISHSKLHRGCV